MTSNFLVFSSIWSRTGRILALSEQRIEKFDDLTQKETFEKSRFFDEGEVKNRPGKKPSIPPEKLKRSW